MKNPTYLRMILTSIIMFLGMIINSWGVRIILIVGVIVLIILQFKYDKQLYDKCQLIDDAEVCKKEAEKIKNDAEKLREEYNNKIHSVDEKTKSIIEDCKKEIKTIANEANKKATKLDAEINKLQEEYNKLNGEYMYEVSKFIISDNITSEEYKSKYNLSVLREKDIIKDGRAVNIDLYDKLELKKQIENDAKQLLRCFNSETASILLALTVKNIDSSKNKIMRCFETLNKLFSTDKVSLSKKILEIKLEQADLMYAYQYQKEQERLQQKAIREQMVEEEKVRREIEKEKVKIEKEEKQFQNEIAKLMGYMQKSNEAEKQLYIDKIRELEDKLKKVEADKENVLEREQNTRAGYVYVISNIGSFGDDVYKIGMTRRLEPMDRVKELGDASVPFEFDVHAMIFSEDAPALETILHNTFKNNQVNKVNPRKEFFKVKLDDIEKVVKENFNATVTFTKVAEAAQYRESLRIDKEYAAV
ncbi:DUF4041 domain-containing protein [Porcipelethomonas ammoniilytica]|uniref:DUF4041 domain-containing protein n=1 Tax=Porcipelethomonas ammoniilytica TaxID=2981722 RepID=UPI0008219A45|nr:DUF4041 domain-containing protein [Porcipelethomonas ammoniilytica]MCU6719961.1 DUF4041 domain-containing protein [Porcipelethomonas ammoniilytica]SCI97868.1 F0F1 ATP synthase subunit B [uncultured Ruminococcus sp.]